MNTLKPDQLLTSHQVGTLLQMDPSSVVKWVNDGLLPAYRTPGGHRRIRAADLLGFLRQHQMYIPDELQSGPRRVLVVEPTPAAAQALTRGMKAYKDRVELATCTSAIEALVRVGAERPDVLVLDADQPELGGLEVLKRLKGNPATQAVEVVLLSGKNPAELERKARPLGARAVVARPLNAARLLELLEAAVR